MTLLNQDNDLDKKLEELLDYADYSNNGADVKPKNVIVQHIKQVFADAGYTQEPHQFDVHGNLKINGQEWYERFEKELNEYYEQAGADYVPQIVYEAAKRATGLQND